MWMAAAGQIFFSLSVGFGVVINYSSYLKKRDDIALGSTTAVAGNEFCEVSLGGLITIPAAFLFLGAAGTVGGTFGLGFQTLPLVFAHMPAGQLFGFLWFFLLFIAAITSSLSMLQPAIAFMEEGLDLDRRGSVSLLGFITLMGTGIVVWFTKDLAALDAMDFWVGSFCIFILATIQTFLYGWVLGVKRGREELERGALLSIPRIFDFVIRYVSPVYLLTVFVIWLHQKGAENLEAIRTQPSVRIALLFVAAVLILFLLLIARAVRVWRIREERKP
jgi:SNF family Na+-dependent transporter